LALGAGTAHFTRLIARHEHRALHRFGLAFRCFAAVAHARLAARRYYATCWL